MVIGPNSIPTYIADGGYSVNYGVAPIPANGGVDSVSAGVMDRFMCFDNEYSDAELEAIKTFFDFFYEDERYPTAKTEWDDVKQGVINVEQQAGGFVYKIYRRLQGRCPREKQIFSQGRTLYLDSAISVIGFTILLICASVYMVYTLRKGDE